MAAWGQQVTLDGSLGPAATLSGPAYVVGANVGQLRGGNLFHSFGRLDLAAGESLTFTGPANVSAVAARVTGGTPTTIAGTVRVDIPGANLILINPAGIVFVSGGQVDVTGSLVITTADFVRLADGGRFDATLPGNSVLTSAPPTAFGFLSETPPASLRLQNAGLGVQQDRVLSVVGGDIQLDNGQLFAGGGRVNVVAARGPAEVKLDPASQTATVEFVGAATRGNVSLSAGSQVNADSATSNRIVIRAGHLAIDDSSISAQTFGAADGGGVDVELAGDLLLTGGAIDTSSFGAGRGGDISVLARSVTLDGRAEALTTAIRSEPGGAGVSGGNIRIATTPADPSGFVRVLDAAQISTTSFASAAGGDVRVDSPTTVLDGTRAAGVPDAVTGVLARTAATDNGGHGGNLTINAATALEILGGAVVSADTFGSGDGGDVTVNAGHLLIDGRGTGVFTGIASGSFGGEFEPNPVPGQFGAAGALSVTVGSDLIMLDRASLASAAFFADARPLDARAGRDIVLRGGSRITAQSGGNGGNVTLTAGRRFRSDRSTVSAEAFDANAGAGGNIDFNPRAAVLNNQSRVIANAVAQDAGNIRTTTDAFIRSPDTIISATSQNGANGAIDVPNVDISAALVSLPKVLLDDAVRLQPLCGAKLPGGASSFVFTGRGGTPLTPGGLSPALEPINARR